MKIYITFIITMLFVVSCIPGENPVKPYDRGGVLESSVNIGHFYAEQIYFSLEQYEVVSQNHITDWDIGFACAENDFVIILNYGKFMKVVELEAVDFDTVNKETINTIPDENWRYDDSEGDKDSTAIGTWWSSDGDSISSDEKVYIIDRGLDEKAKKQGTVKFQITDFKDDTYSIKFADLKDGVVYSAQITKDATRNYIQFSFDDGGKTVKLEPEKTKWDIIFSKYTQLLYTSEGDEIWYSVTGAYLNPNNVETAFLMSDDFQSITLGTADTLDFSFARNAIGHTWKYYDMQASSYFVYPEMVYIIKNVSGFYFKLHFVDFYDNSGNKGVPKFEYQKL